MYNKIYIVTIMPTINKNDRLSTKNAPVTLVDNI
jgi:hypothetical protein